jgi:sulfoxide reductase heme-binding subunit YedZ
MILWEITRASGFIAFAAYTVSLMWGMSLTARSFRPPVAPQFDYHRFVSMLGFLALLTHIATLLLDHFSKIHPRTLLGIGASWQVMLGVIAFWLALALPLSFRAKQRKWLGQRFWRNFHYFGYAVWTLALVHGIVSGTDGRSYWALAVYGTAGALVGGFAWWRWFEAPAAAAAAPARPRPTAVPREAPTAVVDPLVAARLKSLDG